MEVFSIFILINGLLCALAGPVDIQKNEYKNDKPAIFPFPTEVNISDGIFSFDKSVFIMVPEKESTNDDFLAKLLSGELIDKYERPVIIVRKSTFSDKDKFILMGDITNPLVRAYCEKKGLVTALRELGPEGYILSVSENNIVVAANTRNGALYGFESLRQIINNKEGNLFIRKMSVKDSPVFAFRGIKLYLPGRENITFFKRFIKDFVALYKFNKIILELNANMRLDKHPELNIGAVEFYRHLNFQQA